MTKTRSKFLVFLGTCVAALLFAGAVVYLYKFSRPEPNLKAYLSLHEVAIPSNSEIYPSILMEKLSRETLQAWLHSEGLEDDRTEEVLREIQRYLMIHILVDLPEDPLFNYTHYYLLEIENNSRRLFEDVYVRFPSIEAVEIRRKSLEPTMAPMENGRHIIGDIGPDETVEVYGWNNRPFYVQEENGIVLRHGNQPVEILKMEFVNPSGSWVMDNLLLVILMGGLAFFFVQKMVFVIRTCSKTVDPKIGKKLNVE